MDFAKFTPAANLDDDCDPSLRGRKDGEDADGHGGGKGCDRKCELNSATVYGGPCTSRPFGEAPIDRELLRIVCVPPDGKAKQALSLFPPPSTEIIV